MRYSFDDKQHLHTLDGKPLTGTSSIVDVLNKPLVWWSSGKAVETLGWSNPKFHNIVERMEIARPKFESILFMGHEQTGGGDDGLRDYIALLDTAYKAHSVSLKDSATKGTDLHAELERYVKAEMGIMKGGVFNDRLTPFIDWADHNVDKFLWSEAHCFSEKEWVGGISDAGCLLKDGNIAVIDFKSSKEAYPSHFIQAAGYAIEIDENGLWDEGGRVNKKLEAPIKVLIVVPFGSEKVEPVVRTEVAEYEDGFRHAVALYRLLGLDKRIKEENA